MPIKVISILYLLLSVGCQLSIAQSDTSSKPTSVSSAVTTTLPAVNTASGNKDTQEALKKIDSTVTVLKAKIIEIEKNDSLSRDAIQSSMSKALAEWKANSRKHYIKHPDRKFSIYIIFSLLIFLITGFFLLRNTAIGRDLSFEGNMELKSNIKRRPYSYAKVQCLWWTLIIIASYLAGCLYFSELLPVTSTMIILLGGGLVVTVFGQVLDSRQVAQAGSAAIRHQDDDSESFFEDILQDEQGTSVHRLQAVLFNIIFGLGYIAECINNIAGKLYPFTEFDLWQFALLGVSAAGYLGLKIGENGSNTLEDRKLHAAARASSKD